MKPIYLEEIRVLNILLTDGNIPHEMSYIHDGFQICYPSKKNIVSDVVCHSYSYGHEQGLLEMMGLVDKEKTGGDEVQGYLTAEEVFEVWKKDYNSRMRAR